MQNLREDKAFTYGARCSLSAEDRPVHRYPPMCEAKSRTAPLWSSWHEINRIRDEQVDSADLATAKASLSGSFARSLENEAGTVARFALNIERYDLPPRTTTKPTCNASTPSPSRTFNAWPKT